MKILDPVEVHAKRFGPSCEAALCTVDASSAILWRGRRHLICLGHRMVIEMARAREQRGPRVRTATNAFGFGGAGLGNFTMGSSSSTFGSWTLR